MYVKQLHLINLRSFSETTIKFSKGINLLVGNNNSGKSTIIKALYKMQNLKTFNIEDIRKTKEVGRIQIDLDDLGNEDAHLFAIHHKRFIIPEARAIKICMNLFTGPVEPKRGAENLYFDLSIPYKEDKLGRIVLDKDNFFTDFVGFPKSETQNNFIYPFFAKRKTNYYSIQNSGEKESFGVSEDLRLLHQRFKIFAIHHIPKAKNL